MDSLSADVGSALDRQSIQKVVTDLIAQNIEVSGTTAFWSLVSEIAGDKYSVKRTGKACERIYHDLKSKNKELPNDKNFIKRAAVRSAAQDESVKMEAADKPKEVYRELDKTYTDSAQQRLQQMSGAALAEMERLESEKKADT